MRQFLPAMTHAIWHFAKAKDTLGPRGGHEAHPRGTHRARGPEDPRVGAYDAALSVQVPGSPVGASALIGYPTFQERGRPS